MVLAVGGRHFVVPALRLHRVVGRVVLLSEDQLRWVDPGVDSQGEAEGALLILGHTAQGVQVAVVAPLAWPSLDHVELGHQLQPPPAVQASIVVYESVDMVRAPCSKAAALGLGGIFE